MAHSRPEGNTAPLHDAFWQNIGGYVQVFDQIRRQEFDKTILSKDLPKIVAIGDQSTGKSTLIENLAGVSLPRGEGTVTRCPLELCLRQVKGDVPWRATIEYRGTEKGISNPAEVPDAIREAQTNITGGESTISEEVIVLTVEDPNLPYTLTIIDLPGIIQIAVEGQSEEDVGKIERLVTKYISSPECIILVAMSAHQDFQTSAKALVLAQQYDTEQKRTLGVLTKADKVDREGHGRVMKALDGKLKKLEKGYHLVYCQNDHEPKNVTPRHHLRDFRRNQSGRTTGSKNFDEQNTVEERFFEKHEHFRHVPRDQRGVQQLAMKLGKMLASAIVERVDEIQECLADKEAELHKTIARLKKDVVPMDETRAKIVEILGDYMALVNRMYTGKYNGAVDELEIPVNCRVLVMYDELLDAFQGSAGAVATKIESTDRIEAIQPQIRNYRGPEVKGFSSFELFENLVRETLELYHDSAGKLLNDVADALQRCLTQLLKLHLRDSCPGLLPHVQKILASLMETNKEKGREQLRDLFSEEATSLKGCDALFSDTFNKLAVEALQGRPSNEDFHDAPDDKASGTSVMDTLKGEAGRTLVKMFLPVSGQFADVVVSQIVYLATNIVQAKEAGKDAEISAEYQEAKLMFLRLTAYFQIAHQRLLGTIPMRVQHKLLMQFKPILKKGITKVSCEPTLTDVMREGMQEKQEEIQALEQELNGIEAALRDLAELRGDRSRL